VRVLQIWPSHSNSTFNTASFCSHALKRLNVEVANFVYSQELILQNLAINAFRGTDGVSYDGEAILLSNRLMMGYVASAAPDVILIVCGLDLYKSAWKWLWDFRKNLKKPYKIVTVYTESPYRPCEELELAQYSDYVFTNERDFVGRLRQFNPRSWYLPQAYDDLIHYPEKREKKHGSYFCGSGFLSRIDTFSQVDWDASGGGFTLKGLWPDLDESSSLWKHYKEGLVQNERVVEDYRASNICLNIHRQEGEVVVFERDTPAAYARERAVFKVSDAWSMNNRACEIAATGAFQISDDTRMETVEVFGDSVPRFSMDEPAELQELVDFYTQRPELAARLAQEARMRIDGRTYLANMKYVLTQVGG
jgi:hypothetical protein